MAVAPLSLITDLLMETERSHPGSASIITTKPLTIHFLALKLPTEKRMRPTRALCIEYFLLMKCGILECVYNTYV